MIKETKPLFTTITGLISIPMQQILCGDMNAACDRTNDFVMSDMAPDGRVDLTMQTAKLSDNVFQRGAVYLC